MSLRDTLKKAASLLVELPPDDPSPTPVGKSPAGAASSGKPGDNLDALIAEMNQVAQAASQVTGVPTGGASSAKAAPPPASGSPMPPKPSATGVKTVEQIVKDADGPSLHDITLTGREVPALKGPDGHADFTALYRRAGVPEAAFTAEQMLELLNSLPKELPLETKRQTVKVTLGSMGKSLGLTPETLVTDASRKVSALAAYTDHLVKETSASVAATEREIADLEAQVEEKRAAIRAMKDRQAEETEWCNQECDRLDDVLEFFSLDVAPSKYAPPQAPQPRDSPRVNP